MDYFLTTIALPLATLLTVLAQAIGAYLWSIKHQRQLAENTALTREGAEKAATAAAKADEAAKVVEQKTDLAIEIVNGRMEQLIRQAYEKGLAEGQQKKETK